MKITHVITSLGFGGAERELARLLISLKSAGENCEVVCVCEEGHLSSQVSEAGIHVETLGCRKPPGITGLIRLAKYLRASRPQVVHSHLITWAPIAGRLAGVPVVIMTEHGLSSWKNSSQILYERFVACFTDRIIVVAQAIMDLRICRWRIPERKLTLIPNGIDLHRFDIPVDAAAVKREYGLNPDAPVVITVGRLAAVKGFQYFLQAAALITREIRKISFALVGDGPLMSDLRLQAELLGVQDHIKFLGYRPDIERILRAADIFVIASLREGTSIAILEAMAAGIPVVATDVGGNPEIIQEERTGLLVPPQDPESIAEAVIRLLKDTNLASSLSREARRNVEEEYSADKNLQRMRCLYHELWEGAA